ncbi:MAG: transposase [Ardenticatenaceae bacterium]
MAKLDYKRYYRRNLPHIQPEGATFFITSRLADSLPAEVAQRLREELQKIYAALGELPQGSPEWEQKYLALRRHFGKWDQLLDRADYGPTWLADPRIAKLVADAFHHWDGQKYDLESYTIMPNHFHLEITPLQKEDGVYHAISSIMHSVKSYTASEANKLLNRPGSFWQEENYDHYIRNPAEQQRITNYILNNPIDGRLVKAWYDHPWTHCKE